VEGVFFSENGEVESIIESAIDPIVINDFDEVNVGDFNGDGRDELLFRNIDTGFNRTVSFNANGEALPVVEDGIPRLEINGFEEAKVGDFNGDGRDELILRYIESGLNRIIPFNTNGVAQAPLDDLIDRTLINSFDELSVGDFDGDGRDELFLREPGSGENRTLSFQPNRQFDRFTDAFVPQDAINGIAVLTIGDFDGDGRDELLFIDSVSGFNRLAEQQEDGLVELLTDSINPSIISNYPEALAGNFGGDLRDELFVRAPLSGFNNIVSILSDK